MQTDYVDNTKEFRCISLCTGYAGIELGLRRVIPNLRTVAYVEREGFACANLVAKIEAGKLDAAPIWTDIKTFDGKPFRNRIHLITGGYPCQGESVAGKRLKEKDPRWLWPHIARIVQAVKPVWCFFENVPGHLTGGFPTVYRSLRDMGYSVEAGLFTAAECGAPHNRKRLYILAHASFGGRAGGLVTNRENEISHNKAWDATENIRTWNGWRRWLNKVCKNSNGRHISKADFYGVDDGSRKGMDQFRLLGNGVVPQCAEKAFRELIKKF